MKACAISALTASCRSRAWSKKDLGRVQKVANYAVRRCFGMDVWNMREHHVSDAMMYQASNWLSMSDLIMKLSMQWLGHVSRMPTFRLPKQAIFGWVAGRRGGDFGGRVLQSTWLRRGVVRLGSSEIDWFRQSTDRKLWRQMIKRAFPEEPMGKSRQTQINQWRPGTPPPGQCCDGRGRGGR